MATAVGGVPKVVRDHENGIIVPLNNPLKLIEAMQYLLGNKDVRIRMGEKGRELVESSFSQEIITNRLCNIYRNVLDR
jgi:glycosyltransferase involved in cell wall biosynthesis